MADRPIIFSAPMVRALLEGRKTQTRRVLKVQPTLVGGKMPGAIFRNDLYWPIADGTGIVSCKPHPPQAYLDSHPIRYCSGDRLWVRENWQALSYGDYLPTKAQPPYCDVRYAATDSMRDLSSSGRGYSWRPSIHMPRWASRLTLTVTDVRVQRLQDIGEADAIAEGSFLGRCSCREMQKRETTPMQAAFRQTWCATHGDEFTALWNGLHGLDAWDANPWVVALTFTVERRNIDEATR